jgi:hypothetical protein
MMLREETFRLLKQRLLKLLKPEITFLNFRFNESLGELGKSGLSYIYPIS